MSAGPQRRSGALPAMAIGAAVGLVAGQAIESASGGADPAFAGAVGGALGAALGRSGWMRVHAARARGRSAAVALAVLAGRMIGCTLIGVAVVAGMSGAPGALIALSGPARGALAAVGVGLIAATGFAEHRWLSTTPVGGLAVGSTVSTGGTGGTGEGRQQ